MKFLISFIRIDTTLPDNLWPDTSALSKVSHDYVNIETPDYESCESSSDVEARFEGLRNYQGCGEQLICPQAKIKVLRVEPVDQSFDHCAA